MERMKSAVNDALCKFSPYNNFGDYVNVKCDLEGGNKIIITPKRNAPLWVWEVFAMINPTQKMNVELKKDFHPDWGLHRICPICKAISTCGCRCILSDQFCENGHHWYVCPVDHRTVIRQSDHGLDAMTCHCDSTAFYRTE
jgi:hypothetical protein